MPATLPASAQVQSVYLEGFGSFEYPGTVKISAKKCQRIYVEYQMDEDLDPTNAAVAVQIGNVKKKTVNGEAVWFGDLPNTEIGPMPLIGRLSLKVCKADWNDRGQKYVGIKAQKYDVYFGYGRYLDNGPTDKKSKTTQIRFYR
jgi:hypothetical protein